MKTLQSSLRNSPLHLSIAEMNNPQLVLESFHDFYQLTSVRDHLTELIEVALSSDAPAYDSGQKRNVLLNFHHQVVKLVEATHLLNTIESRAD
jgi:hypothetical protein